MRVKVEYREWVRDVRVVLYDYLVASGRETSIALRKHTFQSNEKRRLDVMV